MPGNTEKRVLLNIPKRKALRAALFVVAMALISLSLPLSLNAGTSIVITDVNASSTCSATLTINTASISFPNADPGVVPNIPANENPVSVTANVQIDDGSTATLTALAGGDLVSGSDKIAINNVSWTVTGSAGNTGGLVAGTLSKDNPVLAGSWTQSGTYTTGSFLFFLANSWSYATGTYSQTVTYTITAP
ncbi:MAG: hypothetical protein WAN11_11675 [Syntrophobacteraceae bacterium]